MKMTMESISVADEKPEWMPLVAPWELDLFAVAPESAQIVATVRQMYSRNTRTSRRERLCPKSGQRSFWVELSVWHLRHAHWLLRHRRSPDFRGQDQGIAGVAIYDR